MSLALKGKQPSKDQSAMSMPLTLHKSLFTLSHHYEVLQKRNCLPVTISKESVEEQREWVVLYPRSHSFVCGKIVIQSQWCSHWLVSLLLGPCLLQCSKCICKILSRVCPCQHIVCSFPCHSTPILTLLALFQTPQHAPTLACTAPWLWTLTWFLQMSAYECSLPHVF